MTTPLDTRIRRLLGLLVAVAVIALVGAGSSSAGGRPAASYYTKQQLETMSQSWAARAAHSSSNTTSGQVNRPAASYYTKQQLETMSQSWALRAAVGSIRDLLNSLTPAERKTLMASATQAQPIRITQSGGLDWSDVGIGAAGMLGLVLLAGGSVVALRFSRRGSGLPARHAT